MGELHRVCRASLCLGAEIRRIAEQLGQWCQRLDLLWAEVARVLRPGGRFLFTTLGPGTLRELRRAWAAADDGVHVNRFAPVDELYATLPADGRLTLAHHSIDYVMRYERARELFAELKGLGAHNINQGRASGLTGRRRLQAMLAAYEAQRRDGKLPASYQVIFGEAVKA